MLNAKAMKTIIVISFTNLAEDSRVNRHIRFLNEDYHVIAVGLVDPGVTNVQFVPVPDHIKKLHNKMIYAKQLLFSQYERYYWNRNHILECIKKLSNTQADLILANDIDSLPIALRLAQGAKVIFDAHEYAPLEFEDKLSFRIFLQGYRTYLCKKYIPKVDGMITVCESIANTYEKDTGIKPIVITNTPYYDDIQPRLVDNNGHVIRLVHHGRAIRSRKIENMIKLMDYTDDRFELDMLLLPGSEKYILKLKKLAYSNKRIHFVPPVPWQTLPRFLNQYDIGLFLLEPTNFNYRYALPKKLFEFIQARLTVAIGPSPEMAKIVKKYNCGVVSEDFSPKSLAECLKNLDHEKLNYYKYQSHKVAQALSLESDKEKFLSLVERILKQ